MALVLTDRDHIGESNDDGSETVKDGASPCPADLQQHLQSMFAFLEQHHLLKEAVKLESIHTSRNRYLAIVACFGRRGNEEEETCLLGFDCIGEQTTLGLVLPIYANASITLDGDGGFTFTSAAGQHIFKPVSVHTMWAVLQTLHKAFDRAHRFNHFDGGPSHHWVENYSVRINSDRSCLNEWHALPDVEYARPPSPDVLHQPREKAETEKLIRSTLKEVMMSLDLDVVTSKEIRKQVEEDVGMDLSSYKSFIDEEILTILGQMDGASQIFSHVYLGSEWNAANLDELQRNGVGHILNVTREIDNFFPGQFEYFNIRVYDDEATELLRHWDRTYKFIDKAQQAGSNVLVHCKMGVSRSASVVIAYAMKANNWSLQHALCHVRERRSCVKPNSSFMQQLETYAGILDASRQRHNKLWRSKSETNLKHQKTLSINAVPLSPSVAEPSLATSPAPTPVDENASTKERSSSLSVPTAPAPVPTALLPPGLDVPGDSSRPKSWSPEDNMVSAMFPEQEAVEEFDSSDFNHGRAVCVSLRVPCSNGRTYSVSQNRAVQLEGSLRHQEDFSLLEEEILRDLNVVECINTALVVKDFTSEEPCNLPRVASVKDRICELEAAASTSWRTGGPLQDRPDRTGLVLNLASQFDTAATAGTPDPSDGISFTVPPSEGETPVMEKSNPEEVEAAPVLAQVKPRAPRHQAYLTRVHSEEKPKLGDPFSAQLDRVFDREENEKQNQREIPHRQHSWGAAETKKPKEGATLSYAKSMQDLESFDLVPLPASLYLPEPTESGTDDVPPLGHVRTQREVLENLQQKMSQPRRSLPDENTTVRTDSAPVFNRAVSESSCPENGSVVSRLKKELEAKATTPLTGSFAPSCMTVSTYSMAEVTQHYRDTRGSLVTLRKRSLSVDKMNYHSASKTSSCSASPSPPPTAPLQTSSSSSTSSSTSASNSPPEEDSDLNVKLLVGRFETSCFSSTNPAVPGSSASPPQQEKVKPSAGPPLFLRAISAPVAVPQPQRTTNIPAFRTAAPAAANPAAFTPTLVAKPPVPADGPIVAPKKNRKHQGKTHPLDRLAARQRQAHPVFGTM